MDFAMRRASGTPRVRMPTIATSSMPRFRSRISCAIRARLRAIRSASRTTGMLTSLRPHWAALKSGDEYSKLRIAGLQNGWIAEWASTARSALRNTLSIPRRCFWPRVHRRGRCDQPGRQRCETRQQSLGQFFDPAILPFCNSLARTPRACSGALERRGEAQFVAVRIPDAQLPQAVTRVSRRVHIASFADKMRVQAVKVEILEVQRDVAMAPHPPWIRRRGALVLLVRRVQHQRGIAEFDHRPPVLVRLVHDLKTKHIAIELQRGLHV